jgi:adenosylmethionine-8-amino-7-oxononanoate aminotransferase
MQKQPAGSMVMFLILFVFVFKNNTTPQGGTFAGNVISCAAACATLDVLERDKVNVMF